MIRFCALFAVLATPAAALDYLVPSQLKVTLFDTIREFSGPTMRYRFVVPAIGDRGRIRFADVADDFQLLCDVLLRDLDWSQGDIVISYSSAELPFGEIAPEIVQFFQPFSIQDGRCIWEDF